MDSTRRDSGVDEYAGVLGAEVVAVAATPAPKATKYEVHFCHTHISACKITTKTAHTQIFEQKNEVNRILFYIEGTIMTLGART